MDKPKLHADIPLNKPAKEILVKMINRINEIKVEKKEAKTT